MKTLLLFATFLISITSFSQSICDYGAIPNDNIEDTYSISQAIQANKYGAIHITKGTYIVDKINLPDSVTIILDEGSIIQKKSGTSGAIFYINGSNIQIKGSGVLDGNRTNVISSTGICISANLNSFHDLKIDGITIQNTKGQGGYGIYLEDISNVTITNTKILNTEYIGMFVRSVDVPVSNILIEKNYVNRENEGLGVLQGGIMLRGATYPLTEGKVLGNEIRMPQGQVLTTGSGLCIEFFGNVANSVCSNNTTVGGSMGISFSKTFKSTCSNNSIFNPTYYGIEQSATLNTSVTGNIIDGQGLAQFGINCNSNAQKVTITSNSVYNCTLRSIQSNTCSTIIISSNCIESSTQGNYGIDLVKSSEIVITGNILKGNTISAKAIMINTSGKVIITNNYLEGWTDVTGIHLYANTAYLIDNIVFSNNQCFGTNRGLFTSVSNGATVGVNVKNVNNIP
jgi:hypothetical protein